MIFQRKKKDTEFYEYKTPKNPFPTYDRLIFSEITGSWLEGIYFIINYIGI